MAAGLPVVATDWNGYRDNIRRGQDGFLIPTLAAAPGAGEDIALAVETSTLTYDRLIGLASLSVSVDHRALTEALRSLALDPELRRRMGASGRKRALETFDWPVVLRAYNGLCAELTALRAMGQSMPSEPWPQRADPFRRFADFPTRTLAEDDLVRLLPDAPTRLNAITELTMANFCFDDVLLPKELLTRFVDALRGNGGKGDVRTLLAVAGGAVPANQRALLWLAKFGIVDIYRP